MAGEIELLTLRTLAGLVGYDSGGLAGRADVVPLESNLIAATSNPTPGTSDIFNFIDNGTTTFRRLTYAQLVAAVRTAFNNYPVYVSGRWYFLDQLAAPASGNNIGITFTRCYPVRVQQPMTIDQLGCHIVTGSAGGNLRVGLYNHDNTNKRPSTLVCATGNISTTSSGTLTAALQDSAGGALASVTIAPGLYWGALRADNTTVVTAAMAATPTYGGMVGDTSSLIGSSAVGQKALDYSTGFSFAGNFGSLASTAPDTNGFSNNNALLIGRMV